MGSLAQPEYDYIICGGGNAGCVLASRLAEDSSVTVLVVEAGGTKESVPASDIPAAVAQIFETEADWQIHNRPSQALGNRALHLTRGKFISGCSGSNGTLCIRGSPRDFDAWNVKGWSGAEMHSYMSKAETFKAKPWFKPAPDAHGYNGPILTSPHDNAPISDYIMESFQSKGLPFENDMFTTGSTPHGCGHAVRSIYDGLRTTSADYLFQPDLRPNVTIETHTYVDSLVFEDSEKGPVATAVKIINGTGPASVRTTVKARKEIIITAGAFGTPAILMRSGIGSRSEVEKCGIRSLVDLDGVGKNLDDHLILLSFYEVDEKKPRITNDHHVWHAGGAERSLNQWKTDRTGFMAQFPFGSFAYARLDERLQDSELWRNASREEGFDPMGITHEQPHVEFWNTEIYFPNYLWQDIPTDGKQAFAMITELFSAQSRGTVTISSPDPTAKPVVDHNYLSSDLDMLVFSEGCRLANEIVMSGAGTKDIVTGSWPPTSNHHTFTTREQWADEIRQKADTCYHPAGTCRMGSETDATAVVDAQLRVRGVQRLRIADASIMPELPSGHPQMAVYAIAEKAADMIKSSA